MGSIHLHCLTYCCLATRGDNLRRRKVHVGTGAASDNIQNTECSYVSVSRCVMLRLRRGSSLGMMLTYCSTTRGHPVTRQF